jgi:hypothetical protein
MRGLAQAVKGLKLVDLNAAADAGRRAYRMGIELNQNPRQDAERSAWTRGWMHARDAWFALLRRNDGSLTGLRYNITHRSA